MLCCRIKKKPMFMPLALLYLGLLRIRSNGLLLLDSYSELTDGKGITIPLMENGSYINHFDKMAQICFGCSKY